MIVKNTQELENLQKSGKLLADTLRMLKTKVAPGVTTAQLDLWAEESIKEGGGVPAFLNYKQEDSAYPFPAVLCVSINNEVVHGIPSKERVIQDGDLVMLDLGLSYNGYFTDAAVSVVAGMDIHNSQKLIDATQDALKAALKIVKPDARMGDIGAAIEAVGKERGFGVVDDLGGHSLGLVPHEAPYVGNTGKVGTGVVLQEGLVLAIEPIFTAGKKDIELTQDQWTYVTKDGSRSAETEHTIVVTKTGCQILTQ
jgi:methionyl aminopeptidase